MSKRYTGGVVSSAVPTVNSAGASGIFTLGQQTSAQSNNNWPPFKVEKSLRFRSSASTYLTRTPAVEGNRKVSTFSGWVKRGTLGVRQAIFGCANSGDTLTLFCGFDASDRLEIDGHTLLWRLTTRVFRDPSAWYHIVIAVDTNQSTANNRVRLYINGVEETVFTTLNNPSQSANMGLNQASVAHMIGQMGSIIYYDGCMAEFNFVDGQQLTPNSFGGLDKDGNWSPIAYTGTYGQNGFYLNFKDATSTTTLGYDYSGNGNNWTPYGVNVTTANTTYDSIIDVPSDQAGANTRGNYCTLNPLLGYSNKVAPIDSNLMFYLASGSNAYFGSRGTIGVTSGKWYWEATTVVKDSNAGEWIGIGVVLGNVNWPAGNALGANNGGYEYLNDGFKYGNASSGSYGASYTVGDVIGVALDVDSQTLEFYKNGVSQGVAFTSIGSGSEWFPTVEIYRSTGTSQSVSMNFGQRPFAYTPPAGYKTLNTFNLPEPTIKQPNKHFNIGLYTGTGSATAIPVSGVANPDFVWIKARSGAGASHALYDTIRGFGKRLYSNATNVEYDYGSAMLAPTSTGFNLTTSDADHNTNTNAYVGWQWKAGGTAVTNTSGSITSQVSANPTAGFSIVTYTGTGANATVGHGLSVAPKMVMIKRRVDAGYDWIVGHSNLTNWDKYLVLDSTSAQNAGSATAVWNSTAPSSTIINLGSDTYVNASTKTYVAYCFSEIDGYSKFGSYTGNGSADGPFVYCGFRPKFVIVKCNSTSSNWYMLDSSRSTYNLTIATLCPNLSSVEFSSSEDNKDFLSNGFKVRTSNVETNTNGQTYIYAAFAENPFKYSRSR